MTGPPRIVKVTAAARLVHPFPVATVVVTSLCLSAIAAGRPPHLEVLLRIGLVVLLCQIPVGTLNDFIDRFDDAEKQPGKPIPAGLISARTALAMTVLSLIALVPSALSFGPASLLLMALGTGAGLAYDLWLKRTPLSLLGYVVGFLSLVTWIWLVAGKLTRPFLLVYPAGCLLLVAAHLAQSLPDIETDRSLGQRGLAALLGPKWAFRVMMLSYCGVAAGGAAVSLDSRAYLALILLGISLAPALIVWRLRARVIRDRITRTLVFHVIAPGVGLLAVASLLALRSLGA